MALSLLACGGGPPPARPNVLLVTFDTTRADHLGAYGYGRDTSPNLDRLAAEGTAHTNARAVSSWTLPTHASLFTGKHPASHGARFDPEGPLALSDGVAGGGNLLGLRVRGLAPEERTLAEILAGAGYVTGGVVAGPWMKAVFGLSQGFGSWDDRAVSDIAGVDAAAVTDGALRFLDANPKPPFFLFLNYYDPHGPFLPPPEFARLFARPGAPLTPEAARSREDLIALYDGEIRYADHEFGRLLDGLRERGLYEDTWILVTSDHGELLGEHGRMGHGRSLTEPELRIPLIEKRPAGLAPPARADLPLQHHDLPLLVLRGLGLPVPDGAQGRAALSPSRPQWAEVYPLAAHGGTGSQRALLAGPWKYVWSSEGAGRLYRLDRDPGERHDLAASEPERARALAARLEQRFAALPAPRGAGPAAEVDAETREALRRMGYLESDEAPALSPSPPRSPGAR